MYDIQDYTAVPGHFTNLDNGRAKAGRAYSMLETGVVLDFIPDRKVSRGGGSVNGV